MAHSFNMEISTTNPVPPTGITPTEVPLGITSTTTPAGGAINRPTNQSALFALQEGIFLTTFEVSKDDVIGKEVFTWHSLYPLGETENEYNTVVDGENTRFFVPWELMTSFFSRQCKIDWELNFTAVKVSDCRVSFDGIFIYEDDWNLNTDFRVALNNDSVHKIFDDQDDTFSIVPPMYWMTNNVNTDTWRSTVPTIRRQPAFLPSTTLHLKIRSPYVPNSMQPNTFRVVVTLKPIVRQNIGFAAKSGNSLFLSTYDPQIPRPYFFNRPAS